MSNDDDRVRAYLDLVRTSLPRLEAQERDAIVSELANHIAEGRGTGRPAGEILEGLGDPKALAKSYELETVLSAGPGRHRLDMALRVIGVIAALGLPTIVICSVLGAIGVAFIVAGGIGFFGGLLAPVLPPPGLPPEFARGKGLILGIPLMVGGVAALGALLVYVRALLRVIGQTARGRRIELDWTVLPPWLRPRKSR